MLIKKSKVKVIKLSDQFEDNSRKFPYIHTVLSHIRFRLRSKITYDHEPVLLIEKLNSLDYILPLTQPLDVTSQTCTDNFICLTGKYDIDGAWYTQLEEKTPGVVSFQIAFKSKHSNMLTRFGSCDVVFLTQKDLQLRKLRKQSVFPRCIGDHKQWINYFLRQSQLGYNAFHLAPIQQTGFSKSYYSLKSHLQLSNQIFSGCQQQKQKQLKQILGSLKQKGTVFFIDIVLNHCSFDAQWIKQYRDAVYTPQNTPHLRPAFEIDQIIYLWGNQIKALFKQRDYSSDLQFDLDFVSQIEGNLRSALYGMKLQEYFVLSDQIESQLIERVQPRKPSQNIFSKDPIDSIEQFVEYNIDSQCIARNSVILKNLDKWQKMSIAYEVSDLKAAIRNYNERWVKKVKETWIPEIISNTICEIKNNYIFNNYRQLDDEYPFVNRYFSKIQVKHNESFHALNNGWVSGADSSENFALSQQFYYLRRKVNVWGDLIRIRYGDRPKDSPYAWEYMRKYVRQMAKLFDGFRLDNCHGTQLNVARYMVKEARLQNPNVIIFAELFTDTQEEKALFVRSIGINSTLKQAQHMLSGASLVDSLHTSLGKGARYVGGLNRYMQERDQLVKYSTRKKPILLIYDMTHDNLTYCQKKIQMLQTPVTVLISLMGAFIGSTKGYDQFYAGKVDVTEMDRIYARDQKMIAQVDKSQIQTVKLTYPKNTTRSPINTISVVGSWDEWKQKRKMAFCPSSSIHWAELQLPPGKYQYKYYDEGKQQWLDHPNKQVNGSNNHELTLQGGEPAFKQVDSNLQNLRKSISKISDKYFCFGQYFAFHINDIVVIIRQGNNHEQSLCVIANLSTQPQFLPRDIQLPGQIVKCNIWKQSDFSVYQGSYYSCEIVHSKNIRQYFDIFWDQQKGKNLLRANSIKPGFACVIECSKTNEHIQAIRQIKKMVDSPIKLPELDALNCNLLMYGCSQEQEAIYGSSNYIIPQDDNKQLVYGGFASLFNTIKQAKNQNDLSVKLYDNLREGDWLMDYFITRIKRKGQLSEIADRVEKVFGVLRKLPRYLIPRYFSDFIYRFCHAVEDKMSNNSLSIFERKLKTASTQFINAFNNQKPGFEIMFAAGLPHFSTGWSRCWGRDTFTANQILINHPTIYKQSILQFASAMRHGLIPNLLDSGNNPRYNCRDACWWFIRGVKEYVRHSNDYGLLKQKVNMLFLSDDLVEHNHLKKQGKQKIMLLEEVIHEIMQRHADGISYRQWRAGFEIDSSMNTQGFNIFLRVDEQTGIINGGNAFNCLTWMDKMGSSYNAGNKGYPATPRAGEPVELAGLLYHCLTVLDKLHVEGKYSFGKVNFKKRQIKYSEWADKIKQNFERNFFIPETVKQMAKILKQKDDQIPMKQLEKEAQNYLNSSIVRLRGIYKDVCKAKSPYQQFRLRPNALITLALAPQIINPVHARQYLRQVQHYLLTPNSIGVGTLAQIHESLYCPYYDNSDDSTQIKTAHGFSYHNGPEWVWLYGFYIVAKVNFDSEKVTKQQMLGLLQKHNMYINNDEWCSLPEMTNINGQFNRFSCPSQAWSISSLLMAQQAINKMKN